MAHAVLSLIWDGEQVDGHTTWWVSLCSSISAHGAGGEGGGNGGSGGGEGGCGGGLGLDGGGSDGVATGPGTGTGVGLDRGAGARLAGRRVGW